MTYRSRQSAALVALLVLQTGLAAAQGIPGGATATTLLPEQQAQHVLSRLAFGPRPGDAAKVRAMGADKWIEQQLHPEKIDDRTTTELLKRYSTLDAKTSDIAAAYRDAQRQRRELQREMAADSAKGNPRPAPDPGVTPANAREPQNRALGDLLSAKIARAAFSERQLYEGMVDFWENHFSVLSKSRSLSGRTLVSRLPSPTWAGWDTHVNQGGANGQLANRLADFSQSIHALVTDLGDRIADVVIMTMSEFGRTARQNGSAGTDHGHAGALFVIGGGVKGGKVFGKWPGLAQEQLYEGRDLALTTDFRSVFAEVALKHLGAKKLEAIFPGYAIDQPNWLGLL